MAVEEHVEVVRGGWDSVRMWRDAHADVILELRGAQLDYQQLAGVDLADADLRGISLVGSNLTEANLRGADLRGATLDHADLSDVDLTSADLRGPYRAHHPRRLVGSRRVAIRSRSSAVRRTRRRYPGYPWSARALGVCDRMTVGVVCVV